MGFRIGRVDTYENLEKFRQKGEMFFNRLRRYKELDEQELRGDPDEGLWQLYQAKHAQIGLKIDGDADDFTWLDGKSGELLGQVKLEIGGIIDQIGILCMTKILVKGDELIIDPSVKNFGSHILIIHHVQEFLDRLGNFKKQNSFPLIYDEVEYVDFSTYSGPIGIFKKSQAYRYQNEVRFAVLGKKIPCAIEIGSLADIATIHEVSVFKVIDEKDDTVAL